MSTNQTSPTSGTAGIRQQDTVRTAEVLFVDLDGTLISTDLFGECLIRACLCSPKALGSLLLSGFRGRAALKRATAERITPNIRTLPFREEVLDFVAEQRAEGRTIVLATASDSIWSDRIVAELPLFDDAIASDGKRNLKGRRKLEAIRHYCHQQGFDTFAYVGDSASDFPIWADASEAYVVPENAATTKKLQRTHKRVATIGQPDQSSSAVWQTMRPWQWLKNTLVFAPLILAHQYTELSLILHAMLAFVAMSLCASGIYVLNDLLDVEADRQHPRKRFRPLAAGRLSPMTAVLCGISLCIGAFSLALLTLPRAFISVLAVYTLLSTVYSVRLKREAIADVIALAGLHTLRLIGGGLAVGIEVSDWLLALSIFLFTSLAFAKRHAELSRVQTEGQFRAAGRGYVVSDLQLIRTLGPCSGYLAVLIFALYSQSEATRATYTNSAALWLICLLALFWVSRLWLLAIRGQLNEDPVVFALSDRVSLATCTAVALLMFLAAGNL
ncbi:MAG: UbiA family prenyltransferase [Fuerstiella sp.]|nr:UbiA family prenyltransferase [Fuerstiella sp.]